MVVIQVALGVVLGFILLLAIFFGLIWFASEVAYWRWLRNKKNHVSYDE